MAVYFRHGSNGAYKTAYAVWFEIVPALRAGRLVVTNIEGMKPLEEIEKILDEKFPVGAQLVRLFSRDESMVNLWQYWFCWMPIGALVVIDECQDLYTADVGFKREKTQKKEIDEFKQLLPDGFIDLFYDRWTKVDLATLDSGDEDDSGRTQLDEKGRLLYPHNFYGAFMRHRKYQWDIIMLTPDWTSIPTWLRGCAQEAYSHRSTDTAFRKRKPRIFNHRPNSTKTAPTTKTDFASCSSKKIPVDTFALYKSTGTGGFNESKADISILKSPKFLLAIVMAVGSSVYSIKEFSHVFFSDDEKSIEAQVDAVKADILENQNTAHGGVVNDLAEVEHSSQDTGRVVTGDDTHQGGGQADFVGVNVFSEHFPNFNKASAIYVTGIEKQWFDDSTGRITFHFRIDLGEGSYYMNSAQLSEFGYQFDYIDYCLIKVSSKTVSKVLLCPPDGGSPTLSAKTSEAALEQSVSRKFDIFGGA